MSHEDVYLVKEFDSVKTFKKRLQVSDRAECFCVTNKNGYTYYYASDSVFFILKTTEKFESYIFEPKPTSTIEVLVFPCETKAMTIREFVEYVNC